MTDLLDFADYRDFLREWVTRQPRRGRGQQRLMADAAGVQATFVSQVLTKKANFSAEQGHLLATHMGLSEDEALALEIMILIERTATQSYREALKARLIELRKKAQKVSSQLSPQETPSDLDTQTYFSSWVYPAVHLFCTMESFSNAQGIAERLGLAEERVGNVIEFLLRSRLNLQNGEGGFVSSTLRLHAPKGSPQLMAYQMTTRARALERMSGDDPDSLHFTSVHSVSREDYEKLRTELLRVIKKSDRLIASSEAQDVYTLVIDHFRL